MAVTAVVKDGQILETPSESSIKKAAAKNGMDKEAFLKLLVAQMKYQDPLEPTSNTEFISQYATFSQVEQMQNMAATMELTRASSMVGKLVAVETTDSSGNARQVQGLVEYVTYENNKAFVSINNALYSLDDVVAVIDADYQSAYDVAVAFCAAMDKLPRVSALTPNDKDAVETVQKAFNSMSAYQQSFISDEYIKALQEYVARMAELLGEDDDDENNGGEGGEGEGDEGGSGEGGSEGGTDPGASESV